MQSIIENQYTPYRLAYCSENLRMTSRFFDCGFASTPAQQRAQLVSACTCVIMVSYDPVHARHSPAAALMGAALRGC